MVIHWSALVLAVLGALVYVFVADPRAKELGRISFFCGLFWFAARLAPGLLEIR